MLEYLTRAPINTSVVDTWCEIKMLYQAQAPVDFDTCVSDTPAVDTFYQSLPYLLYQADMATASALNLLRYFSLLHPIILIFLNSFKCLSLTAAIYNNK